MLGKNWLYPAAATSTLLADQWQKCGCHCQTLNSLFHIRAQIFKSDQFEGKHKEKLKLKMDKETQIKV
jgi:hypothetical protein